MGRKPAGDIAKTRSASGRTRDGEQLIKGTVYLKVSVARQLRVYCAQNFVTMSEVMEEAVTKHLNALAGKRRDK